MDAELKELLTLAGLDFDRMVVVTEIDGVMVNETPMRVGRPPTGIESTDMPVERLPNGTPYVPGSTVKGVVRSFVERVQGGCDPFVHGVKGACALASAILRILREHELVGESQEKTRERIKGMIESDDYKYTSKDVSEIILREVEESRSRAEIARLLVERLGLPCPVCRAFGNTELASHVYFFDVLPEEPPSLAVRTRVAIDRFRGAARSGALFDYEFIPAGYRWRFKARLYNLTLGGRRLQEKLLKQAFSWMSDVGLSFGGMKSVGLGRLRLLPDETVVRVYKTEDFSIVLGEEKRLGEVLKA